MKAISPAATLVVRHIEHVLNVADGESRDAAVGISVARTTGQIFYIPHQSVVVDLIYLRARCIVDVVLIVGRSYKADDLAVLCFSGCADEIGQIPVDPLRRVDHMFVSVAVCVEREAPYLKLVYTRNLESCDSNSRFYVGSAGFKGHVFIEPLVVVVVEVEQVHVVAVPSEAETEEVLPISHSEAGRPVILTLGSCNGGKV